MNKAILIIALSGKLGGAQNRYLNLYNYICSNKDDYYLLINRALFATYDENDFFLKKDKIIVLDIDEKKSKPQGIITKYKKHLFSNTPKKTRLRKILRIPYYKLKQVLKWLHFLIILQKTIRNYNLNYIYAIYQGSMWGWVLKRGFNIKFVHSYMDASYAHLLKSKFEFLETEYYVLKNADIVDCLSSQIAKDLKQKINFSSNQVISITPNSFINYDNFYSVENKDNTIVFLSRLVPQKNPILFLQAVELAYKVLLDNDYKVLVVGEGPMTPKIIEFIEDKSLIQVKYINETFKPYELLSKAKIYCSLQKDDNYPSQSLLEAMACENAIIASDVGETRKLVTKNQGILVRLNAYEIARAIIELVVNDDKRKQLGQQARQKVLKEHTIEKYLDYFYSLEKL